MKFLFDLFPVILFFVAYKYADIYVATATAIVASLAQVIITRLKDGQYERMQVVSLFVIALLGGMTLFFRNEIFIKWKPTAVYWILSLIFLITHYMGEKPLIQRAAGHAVSLPRQIWYKLNFGWVIFFALMGFLNLYVVRNYDTDTWVNFKLFGTTGLTFVFIILQGIYMFRYMDKTKDKDRDKEIGKNTIDKDRESAESENKIN